MGGIYNTYICPLQACRNLTLKLFIESHPQAAKVPHQDHFWRYFNADYIAWKQLKMALEVEYMMEYQHPVC